jgi:hypothetical protein
VGVWLLTYPLLATIDNSPRSLIIGLAWLVFPGTLAVIDHRGARIRLRHQSLDARLLLTVCLSALFVWLAYAAAAAGRVQATPSIGLSFTDFAFAAATSLFVHALAFLALFVAIGLLIAGVRRLSASPRFEYLLLRIVFAVVGTLMCGGVVFPAIAFHGAGAIVASVAFAGALVLVWSGIAAQMTRNAPAPLDPLSALLAPVTSRSKVGPPIALLIVPVFVWTFTRALEKFDWDFLLQKISVLGVWVVVFATIEALVQSRKRPEHGLMPPADCPWRINRAAAKRPFVAGVVAMVFCSIALVGAPRVMGSHTGGLETETLLERYASIDPSFQLITRGAWRETGEAAAFYGYLKANTAIAHVDVSPIDVQFVNPLQPPDRRPPHIFLFVIDSLRPDYLSPYNPAVTFTPAIGSFSREAYVFQRAFTRYGATAMSVPSIWTGGMTLHMQYIKPYAPMSTLDKLLTAASYRRVMSLDPISARMLASASSVTRLDRSVSVKDFRLCNTLAELQQTLSTIDRAGAPVFAYSLPQDVHITNSFRKQLRAGESYPGFFEPVASQVHEIDACFGRFIDYLKGSGLYDESIVILTSDHGDSLGEEGRWGHAYTIFPEVIRIPLIVHVPPALAAATSDDLTRVSFSSDIVPTLYALLGYEPDDLGRLYGSPLFGGPAERRRTRDHSFLISSSYGPVYGMLRDDGRTFYIADAVNGRDYAFDLSEPGSAVRSEITASSRSQNWTLIRESIDAIAAQYAFVPR